jgi:hypothetical protein
VKTSSAGPGKKGTVQDAKYGGTGEFPFEGQPHSPLNLCEGLQESELCIDGRSRLSRCIKVSPIIHLRGFETGSINN